MDKKIRRKLIAFALCICMILVIIPIQNANADEEYKNQFTIMVDGTRNVENISFYINLNYSEQPDTGWVEVKKSEQWSDVWIDYNENDTFAWFDISQLSGASECTSLALKFSIAETSPKKEIVYARLGEGEGETDITNTAIYENGLSFMYNIPDITNVPHDFYCALFYENEGDPRAKELIENYIYAYSDLTGDGNINDLDMKYGLATELCVKYFWEDGGTLDGYFDISKPYDIFNRIAITQEGTYSATKDDGSIVNPNKYKYEINLGLDHDGQPVKVTGEVYALTNTDDVLIYTGNNFYIRNTQTDAKNFASVSGEQDMALCVCEDYDNSKLVINGDGGGSTENINPEGDDVYCINLYKGFFIEKFNKYYGQEDNATKQFNNLMNFGGTNKVRVVKKSKTYAVIRGFGESKQVDGINEGQVDVVCQTGTAADEKYTEIYIGNDSVHISPLNSGIGVDVTAITGVTLKDETMSNAVEIQKKSEDYEVTFKSNFYNSVPLVISYSNGEKKEIRIDRIGLVIQSLFLIDDGRESMNLFHGGETSDVSVSYDYNAGQQIVIYATYYHPTNDSTKSGSDKLSLYVTKEDGTVITISGEDSIYRHATGDKVATTDFIIGFMPAKEQLEDGSWLATDSVPKEYGAINAIVLNDGFDSQESFGGTQIGSGKGVYWDGHIEWNYN